MRKLFAIIMVCAGLAYASPALSFTETWNDAFETTPAGSNAVAIIDDRIRELKVDIRERMQVEHNFSTHGAGTDDGTHKAGQCGVLKSDTTDNLNALDDVANSVGWDTTLLQLKRNTGAAWAVILAAEPAGVIKMWAGTVATVPTGYLFCDGSAVSRTTYADLFTAIGTIYGEGNGSTTFNLPDLRDKFIVGAKEDEDGIPKSEIEGSLAASGGDTTSAHVHTGPSHVHGVPSAGWGTAGNPPSPVNDIQLGRLVAGSGQVETAETLESLRATAAGSPVNTDAGGTGNTGSASPAIIPPYYAISYIIKATTY